MVAKYFVIFCLIHSVHSFAMDKEKTEETPLVEINLAGKESDNRSYNTDKKPQVSIDIDALNGKLETYAKKTNTYRTCKAMYMGYMVALTGLFVLAYCVNTVVDIYQITR